MQDFDEETRDLDEFALGNAYDSGYKSGFKWASKEAGQDVKDIVNLPNLTDREKLARILFIADTLL